MGRIAIVGLLALFAVACDAPPERADAAADGGGAVSDAGPELEPLAVRVEGGGRIRSEPDGIDCGRECTALFERGREVTLLASSAEPVSWGGACRGRAPSCTLRMSEPRSVLASFGRALGTLRVEARGDGAGFVRSSPPGIACAPPCEAAFPLGTRVTLAIEPARRTTHEGWDAEGCGAAAPCTITIDGDRTIGARLDHHPFVRLSDTDRDPALRLREDGLAVDFDVQGGARSVQSVAPGSGAFYFEARFLEPDPGFYGAGVATAGAPVTMTAIGATPESFGVSSDGSLLHAGEWLGRLRGAHDVIGFVVDYRGASPIVLVLARDPAGATVVEHVEALSAIREPLYVFVAGTKRDTDYVIEIEPGNDTSVRPFALDPDAALRAAGLGELADALVLGWTDAYAGPADAPPELAVPADRTVASGARVTLTATAIDAEDGDLSDRVEWELLSSPHYAGRVRARGAALTFTPTAVGLHPARARVVDSAGHVREAVVRVRVPGPVAQHDPVRLVRDDRAAPTAELSEDGLRARWTDLGKYGLRASQSLYGEFWYFEITRLVAPVNIGGGLVIGAGNLAPYSWDDVPPSCSVNMLGAVWRDLIWQRDFPRDAAAYRTFGFAVDYRGEHPIVYVIGAGEVIAELVLEDVWVELYPMIYGNPTSLTAPGQYDEAINFGATPFEHDPVAALTAHGVDAGALEVGWGDAHTGG